jgi:hypothetical protein
MTSGELLRPSLVRILMTWLPSGAQDWKRVAMSFGKITPGLAMG